MDPGPIKNSAGKSKIALVAGVVVCTIVLGLLSTGTFLWRQKRKKMEAEMGGS